MVVVNAPGKRGSETKMKHNDTATERGGDKKEEQLSPLYSPIPWWQWQPPNFVC